MVEYVLVENSCKAVINLGGKVMAYVINNECISCGACMGECPTDAIIAGEDKYEINADVCIDCGVCVGSCPTDAISEG